MDIANIELLLKIIKKNAVIDEKKIENWEYFRAEYDRNQNLNFIDAKGRKISEGEKWVTDKAIYGIFKTMLDISENRKYPSLYLDLKFNGEGLLYINGLPYCGLDANRSFVKLSDAHKEACTLELLIEAGVERQKYEFQFRYWMDLQYKEHSFEHARLLEIDEQIMDYYFDLYTAVEICKNIQSRNLYVDYLEALDSSVKLLDLDSYERLKQSLIKAKDMLAYKISCIKQRERDEDVYLVGNSHIDVAYLWPKEETVRKCSRTFTNSLYLMDLYPEFKFIQSQAVLYKFAKEYYPYIYKRIKEKVIDNQWEVEGSMWVEPDCNLISGESMIRQIMRGKKFFKDEFGIDTKIAWLPDTFGFSWQVPQILAGCGIKYFVTQKLNGNVNNIPYNVFRWRGPDQSEVIGMITGMYAGGIDAEEMKQKIRTYDAREVRNGYIYLYGFGDGGGGATSEMIETAERLNKFSKGSRYITSSVSDAVEKIKDVEKLPLWDDELYKEKHRGVYTTHAMLKKLNRRCERKFRDAEYISCMYSSQKETLKNKIDKLWEMALLNQFHDVLPGSSTKEVFESAVQDYNFCLAALDDIINTCFSEYAMRPLCEIGIGQNHHMILCNTLSFERQDLIKLRVSDAEDTKTYRHIVTDIDGRSVNSRLLYEDGSLLLIFPAAIPPLGHISIDIAIHESNLENDVLVPETNADSHQISNDFFIIDFDPDGNISGIYDRTAQRQIVKPNAIANEFQIFEDRPQNYDAWEIENYESNIWHKDFKLEKIRIKHEGPLLKCVSIKKSWRNSYIEQDIYIYDSMPRIDFDTRVFWNESKKLLKVAFPLDLVSRKATYDISYGVIERATHDNTSWEKEKFEVPAHMWADISERGYGVSLINDCKYGHDAKDSILRLTLLKASESPNPEADRGMHSFMYSLYPHANSWAESNTIQEAYKINTPVLIFSHDNASGRPLPNSRIFDVLNRNVFIEAVKLSEDMSGIIIRLVERHGITGICSLKSGIDFSAVNLTNLLEEVYDDKKLMIEGNIIKVRMKAFEIVTIKMEILKDETREEY